MDRIGARSFLLITQKALALVCFCAVLLLGCRPQTQSQVKVPQPGFSEVPQIYVLQDSNQSLFEGLLALPSPEIVTKELSARMVVYTASSQAQAAEHWREVLARESSIVIVGSGVPTDALKDTDVTSGKPNRRFVFWSQPVPKQHPFLESNVTSFQLEQKSLDRWIQKFCLKVRCVVDSSLNFGAPNSTSQSTVHVVGPKLGVSVDPRLARIQLGVRVTDWFRGFLNSKEVPNVASLANGYLTLAWEPGAMPKEEADGVQQKVRKLLLLELGQ